MKSFRLILALAVGTALSATAAWAEAAKSECKDAPAKCDKADKACDKPCDKAKACDKAKECDKAATTCCKDKEAMSCCTKPDKTDKPCDKDAPPPKK